MSDSVLNKLIYDFSIYSKVFPEGDIPIDTSEWRNTFEPYTPITKISFEQWKLYASIVLEKAKQAFPKYEFRLVIFDSDCRGPNRIWLHYKFVGLFHLL